MADPFNQVAQGREGTGAAFLLNGNRAADIFQQNIKEDEQQRRLAEFQRQKAAREQEVADSNYLSSVMPKDYWIAHENEIKGDHDAFFKRAAEIKAAGGTVKNNPELRDLERTMMAKAKYSGDLYQQSIADRKDLDANGDKYSDESKAARAAYFNPKKSIKEYMAEGMVPPSFKPRYTLSGMLNGIKGSESEFDANGRIIKKADREKNMEIAQGLQDTPAFQNFVRERGGNPEIGAFPIKVNGKIVYSTKDEDLIPKVNKYLNDIQPEEYQSFGLTATTKEEAEVELLAMMKTNNGAFGSVTSEVADQLDARVGGSNRKDWQGDASARGWRSLQLREAKEDAPDQESTHRQDWINGMFNGVAGSGEQLIASVKGKGGFKDGKGLKIVTGYSDPNKFGISIPDKEIISTIDGETTTKLIKGRTVTFNKANPNDKIAMNQLISELTGENVTTSKLMTEGGKGKVKGGAGIAELNQPGKVEKKAQGGFKIGQVDGGYKYTGGDPTKQENWVKQ